MFYALVHFPNIKNKHFHQFRNRYDPYATLLKEHIPLIYQVPATVGKQTFINHIEKILTKWHAFDITISGFYKTLDQWLLLTLKDGDDEVIALHDDFYTGILEPYLRSDLPFTPHVGMGFFGKKSYDFHNPTSMIPLDDEKYSQALAEISEDDLTFSKTIDSFSMLELDDSFSTCKEIRSFKI